ncbi:MAG: hypothetical protein LUE08_05875, partial [Akkermansiaceae bacterium]|nr:hypothetical protein [Akkermansiaceae bacterium]
FIGSGRTEWDMKEEERKAKLNYIKSLILSRMKKPDTLASQLEEARTGVTKDAAKAGVWSVMNIMQLLEAQKKVLGSDLVTRMGTKISDAITNWKIAQAEKENSLAACVTKATGLTGEHAMTDWLNDLAKVVNTGIMVERAHRHTVSMSRDEANRWLAMTAEERAQERENLRKQEREQQKKLLIPSEADISELRKAVADLDARDSVAQKVSVTVTTHDAPEELRASKDDIINAILLFEQKDYHHQAENNGLPLRDANGKRLEWGDPNFDLEQTLKPLYDFIGKDGRAFAYAMRDVIAQNGKLLQQAYENRMGVPLPMKEDYWTGQGAFMSGDMSPSLNGDINPAGGKGGLAAPTPGIFIERVERHYLPINWANPATSVFNRMLDWQNNYIVFRGVTEEWRAMLADPNFRTRLKTEFGGSWMAAFQDGLNILDSAGGADALVFSKFRQWLSQWKAFTAIAALAGNIGVFVKQVSGILNGLIGGSVPTKALNEAATEFASKNINVFDWMHGLANVGLGRGKLTREDLLNSKYWQGRRTSGHALVGRRLYEREGTKVRTKSGMIGRGGVKPLESLDRMFNVPGMLALGDRYIAHLRKINEEQQLGLSDEDMKEMALEAIGRTLTLAAQPQTREEQSIAAAKGGFFSNVFLMFSSEMLNKLAITAARIKSGQAINAVVAYTAFGAMNVVVQALWNYLRYGDDDEEERRRRRRKDRSVPETRWEDPRFYASVVWRTLTADIGVVPVLGEVQKTIDEKIQGKSNYYNSTMSGLAKRFVDYDAIYRNSERLIEGRKGRRNKAGVRKDEMTAHDYYLAAQGLAKSSAGVVSLFFPGSAVSDILLSAAVVSNWGRTPEDIRNRVVEETAKKPKPAPPAAQEPEEEKKEEEKKSDEESRKNQLRDLLREE